MTRRNQNLTMFAGDAIRIQVQILDKLGKPVPLSGNTIQWTLKKVNGVVAVTKDNSSPDVVIEDELNGILHIDLQSSETSNLFGNCSHYARIIDTLNKPYTVLTGTITFEQN